MTHRPRSNFCQRCSGGFSSRTGSSSLRQDWCRSNFPGFWENGTWPGNSSDISPIENLWAIVNEPTASEKTLIHNVQVAWRRIKADALGSLVSGVPERMRECIRLHYIGKQIRACSSFCFCFSDNETTAHQFRDALYFTRGRHCISHCLASKS